MPNFEIENKYISKTVAGIDEAGLGPLAGPIVVCSCVILSQSLPLSLNGIIDDSKKLTIKKREKLFEIITNSDDFMYGISIVDSSYIDEFGLSIAWRHGITESVRNLTGTPDVCIIDGNKKVIIDKIEIIESVIKGDQKSYSIASASIIAKVTRDRIMQNIHNEFPEYGFDRHVGYGTKAHFDALSKYGVTKYHRKSYAPIAKILKA